MIYESVLWNMFISIQAFMADGKNNKSGLVQIGRAAEMAGVSRQSLQYYLMLSLVEPTKLSPGGRRLFDKKAVERIKLIRKLNKSGYPLRAIRELFVEGKL